MELPDKEALGGKLYEAAALYYNSAVPGDKHLAKGKLEALANSGSLEAGLRLAVIELGESDSAGIDRLMELANRNYMPSFYELGNVYYFGFKTFPDKEKGMSFWEKAARSGHLYAKLNVLKIRSQNAPFRVRMINVFKIWSLFLKVFFVTLKNVNDERLLGVTPGYH
jgi:TPR repeat protein